MEKPKKKVVVLKTYQKKGPVTYNANFYDDGANVVFVGPNSFLAPGEKIPKSHSDPNEPYEIEYVYQCAFCRKEGSPFKKSNDTSARSLQLCGRCRGFYYCSKECQKSDWANHLGSGECVPYSVDRNVDKK